MDVHVRQVDGWSGRGADSAAEVRERAFPWLDSPEMGAWGWLAA